jgi:hypothetical protein
VNSKSGIKKQTLNNSVFRYCICLQRIFNTPGGVKQLTSKIKQRFIVMTMVRTLHKKHVFAPQSSS